MTPTTSGWLKSRGCLTVILGCIPLQLLAIFGGKYLIPITLSASRQPFYLCSANFMSIAIALILAVGTLSGMTQWEPISTRLRIKHLMTWCALAALTVIGSSWAAWDFTQKGSRSVSTQGWSLISFHFVCLALAAIFVPLAGRVAGSVITLLVILGLICASQEGPSHYLLTDVKTPTTWGFVLAVFLVGVASTFFWAGHTSRLAV